MKVIDIVFQGYWLEVDVSGVPAKSGVYCVYAGTYNSDSDTVSLRKLLYVGESGDVNSRLADHEKKAEWKKHLKTGETLCYSFGAVDEADRNRAEAAVINHHKPPCNVEYVHSFPFTMTRVKTSGRNYALSSDFTVYYS